MVEKQYIHYVDCPDDSEVCVNNNKSIVGHGEDLNHLIWDIKNSKDLFESLPPVGLDSEHLARFVITDGGVTMFKPQK